MLNIIDEYTRERLAIKVGRSIRSKDDIETLADLFLFKLLPKYIRFDNGSEFTAKVFMEWLERLGTKTIFSKPGRP